MKMQGIPQEAAVLTGSSFREDIANILDIRYRIGRVMPVARELLASTLQSAPNQADMHILGWPEASHQPVEKIALYAHHSSAGHLHGMVLEQLRIYAAAGFAVILITMNDTLTDADLRAAKESASLVIQRKSWGRDFGAWKAAWPLVMSHWPGVREVLLVNDSVLGPIRPLAPIFQKMASFGDGVFGLTESRMGPPHLQSYFLMIRGAGAVAELGRFFAALKLSTSKWLMVRRGEYGLTRWMAKHGHKVHAMAPYDVVRARAVNADVLPHPGRGFNPTHHTWDILIREFGFPFIKRELLLKNPHNLSNLDGWDQLVPHDSLVPVDLLRSYLQRY